MNFLDQSIVMMINFNFSFWCVDVGTMLEQYNINKFVSLVKPQYNERIEKNMRK